MTMKLLVVGADCKGKPVSLGGIAHASALHFLEIITQKYPSFDEVKILTDENTKIEDLPTSQNIRDELQKMIGSLKPRDKLVFYFCGHGAGGTGGYLTDENDNLREDTTHGIVGSDTLIVSAEELSSLVSTIPPSCIFTAFTDSCCSGGLFSGLIQQFGPDDQPPYPNVSPTSESPVIHFSCSLRTGEKCIPKRFAFSPEVSIGKFTRTICNCLPDTNFACMERCKAGMVSSSKKPKKKPQNPNLYCTNDKRNLPCINGN